MIKSLTIIIRQIAMPITTKSIFFLLLFSTISVNSQVTQEIQLFTGWNIISFYVDHSETVENFKKSDIDPGGPDEIKAIWEWDAEEQQYKNTTSFALNKGYWVFSDSTFSKSVVGSLFNFETVLASDWNLVGAPSAVIPHSEVFVNHENFGEFQVSDSASEVLILNNPIWGWSTDLYNYVTSSELQPSTGYWVFSKQPMVTFTLAMGGNQPPIANFTALPENGDLHPPLKVMFDASLSTDDGTITTFFWDFDDGGDDSGIMVDHTFEAAGFYDVILIVIDDGDLSASFMKRILVLPPPGLVEDDQQGLAFALPKNLALSELSPEPISVSSPSNLQRNSTLSQQSSDILEKSIIENESRDGFLLGKNGGIISLVGHTNSHKLEIGKLDILKIIIGDTQTQKGNIAIDPRILKADRINLNPAAQFDFNSISYESLLFYLLTGMEEMENTDLLPNILDLDFHWDNALLLDETIRSIFPGYDALDTLSFLREIFATFPSPSLP